MKKEICGTASIERGTVIGVSGDEYVVESLDRDGIVAPAVNAIDETVYAVSDVVCFFLFHDGTGKIICKL